MTNPRSKDNDIVIHCKTKREYIIVQQKMLNESNGWVGGGRKLTMNKWGMYEGGIHLFILTNWYGKNGKLIYANGTGRGGPDSIIKMSVREYLSYSVKDLYSCYK